MTIQHTTVFHCQECGRLAYQTRGMLTPACCGQPMACAVVDLARDVSEIAENHRPSAKAAHADARPAACELK